MTTVEVVHSKVKKAKFSVMNSDHAGDFVVVDFNFVIIFIQNSMLSEIFCS